MKNEFQPKEMGSPEWWLIVMSSPMYEAEALLKQYKFVLLSRSVEASNKLEHHTQITRVNTEIHRFSQLQNRARLSKAVRNICGQEVFEQVMEEAARLEAMARADLGVPTC